MHCALLLQYISKVVFFHSFHITVPILNMNLSKPYIIINMNLSKPDIIINMNLSKPDIIIS